MRHTRAAEQKEYRVMRHVSLRKTFVAGLGLLLASATAPVALADPPGYYFQDLPPSSAIASGSPASTDAQIAAANRKADQALSTAQQALREAQQALSSRQLAAGVSAQAREHPRPIVDGHRVQPRREGNANDVDRDLLQEILGNAAR
jgi:hypothetical protein